MTLWRCAVSLHTNGASALAVLRAATLHMKGIIPIWYGLTTTRGPYTPAIWPLNQPGSFAAATLAIAVCVRSCQCLGSATAAPRFKSSVYGLSYCAQKDKGHVLPRLLIHLFTTLWYLELLPTPSS